MLAIMKQITAFVGSEPVNIHITAGFYRRKIKQAELVPGKNG